MITNIFVGFLCVIAILAGIWAWRIDNQGGPSRIEVPISEDVSSEQISKNIPTRLNSRSVPNDDDGAVL